MLYTRDDMKDPTLGSSHQKSSDRRQSVVRSFRLSPDAAFRITLIRDVLDLSSEVAALQFSLAYAAARLGDITPGLAAAFGEYGLQETKLARAYRSTRYDVFDGSRAISVDVGKASKELDGLLRREEGEEWAFITASNPGSVVLAPAHNAARNRALLAALPEQRYAVYRGEGVGRGEDGVVNQAWAPEQSFLVIDRPDADKAPGEATGKAADKDGRLRTFGERMGQLARAFAQRAFLQGRLEGPAQLIDSVTGEVR